MEPGEIDVCAGDSSTATLEQSFTSAADVRELVPVNGPGPGPRGDNAGDIGGQPEARLAPPARAPAEATPRLALSKAEAAEVLGVSVDFLQQHVMPELRVVRLGRRRLIAVAELERWLAASASRALD